MEHPHFLHLPPDPTLLVDYILKKIIFKLSNIKMASPIVETRLTGFFQTWGWRVSSTSWGFAYTPPGEISSTKFFQIPYQKFQHVKHYLSRISISRNIKLKKCKIQLFSHFGKFFKIFLKTYGTLKMFLWSAQNNFTLY